MNELEIESTVLAVLETILKRPFTLESKRQDYDNWDSLQHIQVIFAIEDELGIHFPEDVLSKLESVRSIVDSAKELIGAA
jgi:acyl carrier protein